MSLRAISSALASIAAITAALIAQLLPEANAQAPLIGSAKPVRSATLYVFVWPNGYSEVDTESSMNSGIVSNVDFSIVGPKLCTDSSEATYCFAISTVTVKRDVVTALKSYGLLDITGFDLAWPKQQLPALSGPAAYVVVPDQKLPPPSVPLRRAFDVLHQYYQAHRLELAVEAQARAAATPSAPPTGSASDPPVLFKRIEYPSPSPGRH